MENLNMWLKESLTPKQLSWMPIFLNKTIIIIVIISVSFQFLCAVHRTEGFSYIIL